MSNAPGHSARQERWYRTIWRWHFYAGLFTVPFILWLSLTGGLYLFRPQIEALLDQPYTELVRETEALPPARLAAAAVSAVPGSVLHRYILPQQSGDARQIVVGTGASETRVYVHPKTAAVLKTIGEEDRLMRIVFRLHGELMAGRWGSMLVELAASWAILMILTGLFLWWPRTERKNGKNGRGGRLAGVFYPRLGGGRRRVWRDLHAVTGLWVSVFALILIFSGLPWAKNWGDYLREVRALTDTAAAQQDWSSGSAADAHARAALDENVRLHMAGHEGHGGVQGSANAPAASLPALNRVVLSAKALAMPGPVELSPPTSFAGIWTVRGISANRPQRATAEIDGRTGAVIGREGFEDRHWIDRAVGYGIAAHEGALFGIANQLLALAVLLGLVTLSLSSLVLWWRRRPAGRLGAPPPQGALGRSWPLAAAIVLLALIVPLFGISLALVILAEKVWLARVPRFAAYLGLRG